jgi:hypothetical protein
LKKLLPYSAATHHVEVAVLRVKTTTGKVGKIAIVQAGPFGITGGCPQEGTGRWIRKGPK